jgi:hypothetical protein
MIYPTAFILALFLTHIACALPRARRDPISPESSTPDSYGGAEYRFRIPSPLRATSDKKFDNPEGSLNSVACSDGEHGLAARFPKFGDIPGFAFIGGAYDIAWNSPNCGGCWLITNKVNGSESSVFVVTIDTAEAGFNIAEAAFKPLNFGQLGGGPLDVVATKLNPQACGL